MRLAITGFRAIAAVTLGALPAEAQDRFGAPGYHGACTVYAICDNALSETCKPTNKIQRTFATTVVIDGNRMQPRWIETAYSRFPESDVNETTAFLSANWLAKNDWQETVTDFATGKRRITGVSEIIWLRMNHEDVEGLGFDLYQFNLRGLVKRWKMSCKPGEF